MEPFSLDKWTWKYDRTRTDNKQIVKLGKCLQFFASHNF